MYFCGSDGNTYKLIEICKAHCNGVVYEPYYPCGYEISDNNKDVSESIQVCSGAGTQTLYEWMKQMRGFIYHSGPCEPEEQTAILSKCYRTKNDSCEFYDILD